MGSERMNLIESFVVFFKVFLINPLMPGGNKKVTHTLSM